MGNKNNWIIGILILVVALGIIWQLSRRSGTATPTTSDELVTTTEEEEELTVPTATETPETETMTETETTEPTVPAVSPAAPSASPAPGRMFLLVFFRPPSGSPATCNFVVAARREVPATKAVARAALTALLAGPGSAETARGLGSAVAPGLRINQLTISNGVARLDLNAEPARLPGDACAAAAAKAQLERTLKQFPTVRAVVLSINGQLR